MSETVMCTVPKIHFGHCARSIKEEVSEIFGVGTVEVDINAKVVTLDGHSLSDAELRAAIQEAGYEAGAGDEASGAGRPRDRGHDPRIVRDPVERRLNTPEEPAPRSMSPPRTRSSAPPRWPPQALRRPPGDEEIAGEKSRQPLEAVHRFARTLR